MNTQVGELAITLVAVALLVACGGDDAAGSDGGGHDGAPPPRDASGTDGAGVDGAVAGCIPRDPPGDGMHVTTAGAPTGDGSMAAPWDLASVLSGDTVVAPGTTVWVHGGTYTGTFTARLSGTAEAPIVIRAVPGERATLDAAGSDQSVLGVRGAYTWYWGLEIMNSDTNNRSTDVLPADVARGSGVSIEGAATDVRFINLAVHDAVQGISFWIPAVDSEIYGCLVSLNGYDAPDRPHGHAIYTQNMEGTKRIEENLLFHGFSYGVHAYTEGGALDGFDFIGNVVFQTGTPTMGPREGGRDFLIGGLQPASRILVEQNFGYSTDLDRAIFQLGYSAANQDIRVIDNYIAATTSFGAPWTSVEMRGNTFVGDVAGDVDPADHPDNTYLSGTLPTETRVFVRANRYEPGRAHIIVYDWAGAGTVSVDVSSVLEPGMAYEIRNATDFFGAPVVSGVYDGAAIDLSLAGLDPAQAIGVPGGIQEDERASPTFAVFVLMRTVCP